MNSQFIAQKIPLKLHDSMFHIINMKNLFYFCLGGVGGGAAAGAGLGGKNYFKKDIPSNEMV